MAISPGRILLGSFVVEGRKKAAGTHEVYMKKRMSWERQEKTYVHGYWIIGERLFLKDGEDGWYVSSWSDSTHIVGYWIAEGIFYQASIEWVTESTVDLEIIGQVALDPERERVTWEAIELWKRHSEDRTFAQGAGDESVFHGVAA